MKRKVKGNYDIYSRYTHYVPGLADMVILIALLMLGALIGSLIASVPLIFMMRSGVEHMEQYTELISYPIMFIPPMMYAGYKSLQNSSFEVGYKMDSNHFSPLGAGFCAILVIFGTLAASYITEPLVSILPPMPKFLEDALASMTGGNFIIDFICVSIMAPFCEEWLCRGMVLRGLLNTPIKHKDGTVSEGMKPVWAIVISAAFFALIHLNPWQAIPAFLIGCLLGYVYYKTGSLKLTMLMHFTNNTFAVVMSHIDRFKDVEEWSDILAPALYWAIFALCIAIVIYVVSKFKTVQTQSVQGNCDKVSD